jgi:SMODS and SLOG-associating 2TM effector domain 1/SMODS and SLOG-associating 2TM effector domain 3
MNEMFQLAWKQYRTWAVTSRNLKAANERWKRRVLALTLAGTAFGTLAPFAGMGLASPWQARIAAILGTACLAIATYFAKELLGAGNEERWTRARAAAEAFKSDAHKYVVRAAPYDGEDHISKLSARLKELDTLTKGYLADNVPPAELTKGMPTAWWSVDDYIAKRLNEQIDWYRTRGVEHSATMKRGRIVALTLGGVAVVLSALIGAAAADGTFPSALLGIVTTAGGAVGGYFQAGHYEGLALKYRETADALERRRAEIASGTPPEKLQLVNDAEAIMQAENAAWLAQLAAKTA